MDVLQTLSTNADDFSTPPAPPKITIEQVHSCVGDSVRESVIIVIAYIVIICAAEQRLPDFKRLCGFLLIYIPVVTALKLMYVDISKNIANAAGFALGNALFGIVSGKPAT
jgi:hypothetical protein